MDSGTDAQVAALAARIAHGSGQDFHQHTGCPGTGPETPDGQPIRPIALRQGALRVFGVEAVNAAAVRW